METREGWLEMKDHRPAAGIRSEEAGRNSRNR